MFAGAAGAALAGPVRAGDHSDDWRHRMTACVLGKGPLWAQTPEGQGMAMWSRAPSPHGTPRRRCAFSVSSSGPFLGTGVHGPVYGTGLTQVPARLLFAVLRMQM